jgi:DNA-binding MarR family transcriptional regulator
VLCGKAGATRERDGDSRVTMWATEMACMTEATREAPEAEAERTRDPLLLDNQLCYALYAAAHRMTKSYRPLLERIGLTYPQYLVLMVLWETDGVTVSEIGRRLRLDSGTLTPVLKRLEAAGLLQRNRRRSDEREVEIALTEKGRALRADAAEVRQSVMCQLDLTEPEVQAMRIDLNHLIDSLSKD